MAVKLSILTKSNLEKCRASAIAAVDSYNRPGPQFRTTARRGSPGCGLVLAAASAVVGEAGAYTGPETAHEGHRRHRRAAAPHIKPPAASGGPSAPVWSRGSGESMSTMVQRPAVFSVVALTFSAPIESSAPTTPNDSPRKLRMAIQPALPAPHLDPPLRP